MAFDYPNSPTVGQVFNGFVWDGEKWIAQGSASVGAVRYDIAQGLATGQQDQGRANILAASSSEVAAAASTLRKNYVLNGAMMVSQENGAAAGAFAGYYPVDMFYINWGSTTGIVTAQQVAAVTPGNSPNRARFTCTTADATVGAGDNCNIWTAIEGYRMADLRYGAAGALQTTLRFGVKAPAGTYGVVFQTGTGNRSYIATFTIAAGQANTDTLQSITIPGDIAGTWAKDNITGMWIGWTLMCGTTYQTTANAWKAGSFMATSAQFNFLGATGRVFELFDVGLYVGAAAPPFLVPDYAAELILCQRYYQVLSQLLHVVGYASAGVNQHMQLTFPTPMRTTPSVTVSAAGFSNCSGCNAYIPTSNSVNFYTTMQAAGAANYTINAAWLNARLN